MYSAVVGLTVAVFVMGLCWWAAKAKRECEREVLDRFAGQEIVQACRGANYFGQESLGLMQVRGNGMLVMTKEQLFFQMWKPKRRLEIPAGAILDVTTAMSHLGKSKFVPLLKVIFLNEAGRTDSAAWIVRDLESWKVELTQLIPRQ